MTRLMLQKSTFLGRVLKAEASSGPLDTQCGKYEWCTLVECRCLCMVFVQFIGAQMLS